MFSSEKSPDRLSYPAGPPYFNQISISIPQVSRNMIRSLAWTVMLSTSAAHRLASNSVMSSGRPFTLSMKRSIFLCNQPLPHQSAQAGEMCRSCRSILFIPFILLFPFYYR